MIKLQVIGEALKGIEFHVRSVKIYLTLILREKKTRECVCEEEVIGEWRKVVYW